MKEPLDPSDLKLSKLTSFSDLNAIAGEWDEFISQSGSDIYFTTDWLAVWWDHYGENRRLYAFAIHHENEMIAALPFMVENFGIYPFSTRLARFVGADSTIPIFCPAVKSGYELDVINVILDELISNIKCDIVSFSPLSGETDFGPAVRKLNGGRQEFRIVFDDTDKTHVLFNVGTDFDEYMLSLPTKFRSELRRRMRNLSKDYKVEYRTVGGADAKNRFDSFVKMHQSQWSTDGRLGHFGDWPKSLEFNRSLVERLAPKDQVRFHEILGDGELLSSHYGFVLGQKGFARLTARKVDQEFSKLSLGNIANMKMLESFSEEGFCNIEAGPGHYSHKSSQGGVELSICHLVVSSSKISSRLKGALILAWADFLNFAYYRVWYLKLSPRFNLGKRPLWRAWIRTRL